LIALQVHSEFSFAFYHQPYDKAMRALHTRA